MQRTFAQFAGENNARKVNWEATLSEQPSSRKQRVYGRDGVRQDSRKEWYSFVIRIYSDAKDCAIDERCAL